MLNLCLVMFFCAAAVDAEITQLSAVHGEDEFNMYILPGKPISLAASRVTHLTMNRGKLYHRGKPMKAVGLKEALENFMSWLQDMKEEILFAHNGRAFDSKRIVYSLLRHELLYPFQDSVIGFVDTLLLFKKVLPLREKYSQQSLV